MDLVNAVNPQPSTLNPQPSTLNPQPSTLNQVVKEMNGTVSANASPILDFFVMIHAKRFLGNKVNP
jgi:hypothetical protein